MTAIPTPMPFDVSAWQVEFGEIVPDSIIDIRQPRLFDRGHIRGAINVPYEQLQGPGLDRINREHAVLVVDPSGARAAEMAMWLRRHGYDAGYLIGGYTRWNGPLERGE